MNLSDQLQLIAMQCVRRASDVFCRGCQAWTAAGVLGLFEGLTLQHQSLNFCRSPRQVMRKWLEAYKPARSRVQRHFVGHACSRAYLWFRAMCATERNVQKKETHAWLAALSGHSPGLRCGMCMCAACQLDSNEVLSGNPLYHDKTVREYTRLGMELSSATAVAWQEMC